jgi:hypothetical protein
MNNLLKDGINKKLQSRKMVINNNIDVDLYDEEIKEYIIKIDSRDRNIDQYPNPFKFKVRFNDNEAYGQAPVIQARYQNVKSIELLETIIPKHNYSQIYNKVNYNFYEKSIINSLSILETNSNLKIKLNKNDTIIVDNMILEIIDFVIFSKFDCISVDKYPNFTGFKDIIYSKVKLNGTAYSDGNTNYILGFGTNFTILENNDKISLKNRTYIIESIISDFKIKIKDVIYDKIEETNIFLKDKKSLIKCKFLNKRKEVNLTSLSDIGDVTDIIGNDILLTKNHAVQINNYFNNKIILKKDLEKPIINENPLIIKNKYFEYITGYIEWDKDSNQINGISSNFFNYGVNSIIHLSQNVYDIYLKVTKIISDNKIHTEILIDNGLTSYKGDTINNQKICNYSYINNKDNFSNNKFILINIDEFNNGICNGTNNKLSEAFGILYPSGVTNTEAYFSGNSKKIYDRRNLQNINSLTISLSDSKGDELKMNNLLNISDTNHPRSIYNLRNQVCYIFKIVVIDRKFN